jgi:hypothetical protein
MVLLYIDDDGLPALEASASFFDTSITGTRQILPYIPNPPSDSVFPVGAVRLVSGTSTLSWGNLYDVRPFYAPSSTGTASTDIGAAVYRNATYAVPSATGTPIPFNVEEYDTDGLWVTGTATRFTCQTPGRYMVAGTFEWAVNATGRRNISIYKNGAIVAGNLSNAVASVAVIQTISFIINMAVTDYVQLYARQNSGGNLNLTVTGITPKFRIQKL